MTANRKIVKIRKQTIWGPMNLAGCCPFQTFPAKMSTSYCTALIVSKNNPTLIMFLFTDTESSIDDNSGIRDG